LYSTVLVRCGTVRISDGKAQKSQAVQGMSESKTFIFP
jgi:hypothetical protein